LGNKWKWGWARKEGEPDFGHVGEMTLMDDDRRNFLRGNMQHLLYFWHVMDTCDLLIYTLMVLPNEFTASSAGVPSTQKRAGDTPTITNIKRAREEQQADDNNFKHHVSESFGHLALAEGHLALGSALKINGSIRISFHPFSSFYCVLNFVLYLFWQPETLDQPHV
jgi:hypothetical protein